MRAVRSVGSLCLVLLSSSASLASEWTPEDPGLTQVSVDDTHVWGVNSRHEIYRQPVDGSGSREKVCCALSQVSASGKGWVWGVQSNGTIWKCAKPCAADGSGWQQVPGTLAQVSGGDTHVWGIQQPGDLIFVRPVDGSGQWRQIRGNLAQVSASGRGWIWGVNRANAIYKCAAPCLNGDWKQVRGKMAQVSGGLRYVWGIQQPGDLIFAQLVDGSDDAWTQIPGNLVDVSSASGTQLVWGVNRASNVYRTTDTTATRYAGLKRSQEGPLSPEDLQKVMTWIATKTSEARISYCYKRSVGRGAGAPLSGKCPAGSEQDGQLCYPRCRDGYDGQGPLCWARCSAGFSDVGAFCQKPAPYTREGFPWQPGDPPLPNYAGPIGRCEAKHGRAGCEQAGAIIYPKCKAGFHNAGSDVCSPDCPSGWNDSGTGCAKPSYGRTAGKPLACPPGLERGEADLLCYPACPAGYQGVGPVCWQECLKRTPGAWQHFRNECGVGCADSNDNCALATTDMVLAPINAIVSIVTMGLSNAAAKAANAAARGGANAAAGSITKLSFQGTKWANLLKALEQANKLTDLAGKIQGTVAVVDALDAEVERWANAYLQSFEENTSAEVERAINARFNEPDAEFIKRAWAQQHLMTVLEADGWRVGKSVATIASFEPTGVVAAFNAFAQPLCPGDTPFPKISVKS